MKSEDKYRPLNIFGLNVTNTSASRTKGKSPSPQQACPGAERDPVPQWLRCPNTALHLNSHSQESASQHSSPYMHAFWVKWVTHKQSYLVSLTILFLITNKLAPWWLYQTCECYHCGSVIRAPRSPKYQHWILQAHPQRANPETWRSHQGTGPRLRTSWSSSLPLRATLLLCYS